MHRITAFFVIALMVAVSAPLSAEAATRRDSDRYSYRDYGRLSSSLRKKIAELDDDPVKYLPIPVALVVAVGELQKNFGDARDGGSRSHEGLDIMAPRGSYIASPTDAVVTKTGKEESAGIYVYTTGPGGEAFRYMHLDRIADGIKSGTELKAGDLIGYVGDTGNAKGGSPHLHFEIRDGREATDPYPRLTRTLTTTELLRTLTDVLTELKKEIDD